MATAELVFFTPPKLAKRYGVSTDKVVRWILAGELEAMNFATTTNGRPRYKIPASAVEAFEARRQVISRPSKPRPRRSLPTGIVRHFRD